MGHSWGCLDWWNAQPDDDAAPHAMRDFLAVSDLLVTEIENTGPEHGREHFVDTSRRTKEAEAQARAGNPEVLLMVE